MISGSGRHPAWKPRPMGACWNSGAERQPDVAAARVGGEPHSAGVRRVSAGASWRRLDEGQDGAPLELGEPRLAASPRLEPQTVESLVLNVWSRWRTVSGWHPNLAAIWRTRCPSQLRMTIFAWKIQSAGACRLW